MKRSRGVRATGTRPGAAQPVATALVVLFLPLAAVPPPARASLQESPSSAIAPAATARSPLQVIRARDEAVQEILRGVGEEIGAETQERLKDVINGVFDFRELSRLALGKHWEERTEEERTAFVDVFRRLIRDSSVKKLSIYRADRITYQEPRLEGDRAECTALAHKGNKSVEIVYRMHRVNGEWLAYDMVIDGASTARTYRDAFYKEIAASSYQAMYDKLVDKLKQES